MRYCGVIFDLDGTLLDSNWVWDKIDEEFPKKLGLDVKKNFYDEIAHMTTDQAAEYMIDVYKRQVLPAYGGNFAYQSRCYWQIDCR